MINPEDAKRVLDDHFKQISLDEFKACHAKYVDKDVLEPGTAPSTETNTGSSMILWQPEAAPLRLDAYLACALTGLNEEQRKNVFQVSDIVASVCDELDIFIYEPRKATDPVNHTDVPPEKVYQIDRENVLNSDLIVHICDYPSTGAGEELDFALAALIPIILISHGETKISRMVTGIPAFKLEIRYTEIEDLRVELRERLTEIRPIIEERKLAFSDYDRNIVGNKVRSLRQELQLTREDVASHSNGLLAEARLKVLEENTDKISNPSLLELRTLATVLKTTVADLVEPDLHERLIVLLQEWIEGRQAARYGISVKDRNRILTRILLRLIDSLQKE